MQSLDLSPAPSGAARAPGWVRRWLLLALLWLAGCASLPHDVARPVSTAWQDPGQTALGQRVQSLAAAAVNRHDSGFKLLGRAERAYGGRLALIDAAQKTLDLQYYAIHADGSTELLMAHLREAAARGVRVRILLDDFNTVGPDAQVLQLAFEPRIEVRLFNPLPGSRSSLFLRILGSLDNFDSIQHRMHNKVFIADNAMAITGGRNLGDAYFGQAQDSNFVDLDVLAAGGIVRQLSASFDGFWNNDLAYPVQSLISPEQLAALKAKPGPAAQPAPSAPGPATTSAAPAPAGTTPGAATPTTTLSDADSIDLASLTLTWAPAAMLADKPAKLDAEDDAANQEAQDTVVDGLLALMAQVRQDVLIVSPYFVPGAQMMPVFAELRRRGVRVRVLTNSLASNDAPLAHVGYARYRKALLQMGVELYEMRTEQPGRRSAFGSTGSVPGSRASLHAKVLVMDGRLTVVGSMNLDLRSQLQNSEVALLIRSASLARTTLQEIEPAIRTGTYKVELVDGGLVWRAPQGSGLPDSTSEPDVSAGLKFLLLLAAPFAPDAML
jgi:phosphatidylserine/phosphatidylglycerophosphate/cardiolipin synthase-like enzyme